RAAGLTASTSTGRWVGTLDYVSPEQIRGELASARSDVYSLGAVLFECLTGSVPFPRPSEVAVMYAHLNTPPPSAHDCRPELPASLDPVLAAALAKEPDEQPISAAELVAHASDELTGAVGLAAPTPGTRSGTGTGDAERETTPRSSAPKTVPLQVR